MLRLLRFFLPPLVTVALAFAPPVSTRAQSAREDSVAKWFPSTRMPTLEPIIIRGKEFTVRELVVKTMKGERSKLAGHANATYRIATHVSVVWPEKKEVTTEVYRIYGDSTGFQRRVLLAAREEKFKKKDGAWVFEKTGKPDTESYRIADAEISRFTRVPVYLENDEQFDFALLDRKLEKDRVVFHVRFKPKSDFSEMPNGELWVDGNGFRVVHEIYDFTNNPFPLMIKGVRRISLQWMPLPGGEWVPKQLMGEIDIRRNAMPFIPSSVSFKQTWEDFRFDVGFDERLFGKDAPKDVAVRAATTSGGTSALAPPAAADTFYAFVDSSGALIDSVVVDAADSSSVAPQLLAELQAQDDAAFSSEVIIENQSFIDSTAARHDALGIAGLGGDIPLYGSDWKLGLDPKLTRWDYNRVEGFVFGGEASFHRADKKSSLSAFGAYATASEKFRYRAEVKTELPKTDHKLSLVASFRDRVEPFGSNRIALNGVRAFVGGADEQDYLHRVGGAVGVVFAPWEDVSFDAGFEGARERGVTTDADFSFWGDLNHPNPAIDEGDEHAVVAGFTLEGRRWLNARITQRLAGGALGGDFRYARTDIMLNARGFVLGRQELDLTLKGVTTGDAPPFQQLADVGGLSTVRGYDRRTHVGNHSFAARLEYLFPYDVFAATRIPVLKTLGIQFIPWGDTGRVGEGDSQDWITSAGFGLQRYLWPAENAANLRLDFAWPLDNPDQDFAVYLWFTALR
jgi:hypothetical protein